MKTPRRTLRPRPALSKPAGAERNPIKVRRRQFPAALEEQTKDLTTFRIRWFEANQPEPMFQGRSWLSTTAPQSQEEWELQRLTWYFLNELNVMFNPTPGTTWRDYAVEALRDRLRPSLRHLLRLAGRSDQKGLDELAGIGISATEALRRLARLKSPSGEPLLKAFAQKQIAWPMLRSFHPHFDTKESEAKRLLADLAVGEKHPLNVFKGRWNPNDSVGRLALKTWRHLESIRSLGIPAGWGRWMKSERDAFGLPEFTDETWIQWFEVGRRYIEETHKTPERIAKLNTLITAPSKKAHRCSYASRKTIRSHFWTRLKDRFRSMAGQNRE